MSDSFAPLPVFSPERKLSGTTRVLLAFVAGTLFALLPVYYLYTGSDASRRAAPSSHTADAPAASEAADAAIAQGRVDSNARFAARMTYELSQAPEEPAAATPKLAAAPRPAQSDESDAPAPVARATAGSSEALATRRVSNARPISATPPDPRDTTGAIEKEARRAQSREPGSKAAAKAGEAVQPRVVEGRDLVLPSKPVGVATRAIVAGSPQPVSPQDGEADPNRRLTDSAVAFLAAQERKQLESQVTIVGVTPIGPAPDAGQRGEAVQKSLSAQPALASADVVESRLAATRDWLTAAPQTTHTIQIMGATNEEQLKAHLKSLSKVLEPSKIYVFRTLVHGKPSMTVVYGEYADRQAALQALEKLPASVGVNRPVLRTVSGIRSEMKQNGIKGQS